MLKRLLSVGIALVGTIVALVIYWIVFMPNLHVPGISESAKLVLALVEVAVAIYLFIRRTWPALLLLIGSIPMLLLNVSMCGWEWRMERFYSASSPADDPRLAFLFPGDNEHSPINSILFYIFFLTLCVAVAFFWYFFRVADRQLTNR